MYKTPLYLLLKNKDDFLKHDHRGFSCVDANLRVNFDVRRKKNQKKNKQLINVSL